MKRIQINQVQDSITIDAVKNSPVIDVSQAGPETIAVQLVLTSASTPVGINAYLQGSLDNITFFDVSAAVALSANGTVRVTPTNTLVEFIYYRVRFARTSGSIIATPRFVVYGDTI